MKLGFFSDVISDAGVPILATITVYDAGTTNKSSIWSDAGGTVTKDNPFQTDVLGRFQFFASPGKYDIEVSGTGITTYKIENVNLSDVTKSTELTDMPGTLGVPNAGKAPIVKGDGTAYELGNPNAAAHVILGTSHSDALAGTVILGDLIHGNATPNWARLAGQITTTRKFLRQVGTGAVSAVPEWDTLQAGDIPAITEDKLSLSDVTTANALTSKHGYCPKGSGNTYEQLRGDLTFARKAENILFSVYASAAQDNLTDKTWTTIVLGTELFDVGGNFASNTFTAPVTGYYLFFGSVGFKNIIAQTVYHSRFYKNGDTEVAENSGGSGNWTGVMLTTGIIIPVISGPLYLTAGNTIVLQGYVDCGVNTVDIDPNISYTFFKGVFLSL